MSVPTKTGLEIMKSCLVREREDGLQYIPDDIHLKYILLEDHQEREQELLGIIKGLQNIIKGEVVSTEEMKRRLFGVGGKD